MQPVAVEEREKNGRFKDLEDFVDDVIDRLK